MNVVQVPRRPARDAPWSGDGSNRGMTGDGPTDTANAAASAKARMYKKDTNCTGRNTVAVHYSSAPEGSVLKFHSAQQS